MRSTQVALEQIAAANAGLEQRVAERTSELRDAAVATVSASLGALFDAHEVGVWQLDPQQRRLDYLATDEPPGAAPRSLALEHLPALQPILAASQPLLLPADALPRSIAEFGITPHPAEQPTAAHHLRVVEKLFGIGP